MNDNNASEIRRAVARESRPAVLRRWVLELLEDRVRLQKSIEEMRTRIPGE